MDIEKIFKRFLQGIVYLLIIVMTFESALSDEIPSVQLEDTSGISYLNIFNYNTSVHNNLTELQGGLAPNQYYHLNLAQYTLIGTLLGNETYFPFLNVDWINGTNATFINITKDGVEVATLDDVTNGNVVNVKNVAGETAIQGSAMMYDSYNAGANKYNVVYANISSIEGHSDCILKQTLSDDAEGLCVIFGMIENIDTSIWNDGDHLWLNGTDGSMTNEVDYNAVCVQHLGIVLRSHAVVGTFYARPESRCAIDTWNTTAEIFNAVNNGSFAPVGYGDEWNKTYADTLYTNETDTTIGNCSIANTCSAIVYNTNTSWITENQNYNTTDEIFNAVNNNSFAPIGYGDEWNKTYADNLYSPINHNPFDQSLNTTDDVQFNNVTIDESVDFGNDIEIYANTTCGIFRAGTTYFEICK